MVSLIKEFIERKEEKEEKKLQKLQEMHNDKKTFFGQFLKVFEKSVQDKGIFFVLWFSCKQFSLHGKGSYTDSTTY